MEDAAEALVTAYNALTSKLDELRTGSLQSESLLLAIERAVREQFSGSIVGADGSASYIFDLGFTIDKNGTLSLDADKLSNAIAADAEAVVDFFSAPDVGFGLGLANVLHSYVNSGGIIDSRTEGLNARSRSLDSESERLEFRLTQTEERFRGQFAALDSLLAQLQTTSSYLTQQLQNLPLNNPSSGS
jgi:flagellar hook-associated protein 2